MVVVDFLIQNLRNFHTTFVIDTFHFSSNKKKSGYLIFYNLLILGLLNLDDDEQIPVATVTIKDEKKSDKKWYGTLIMSM